MERLFSPCTRSHDIFATQSRLVHPGVLQELNLDVSTEEFLSTERAFAYADLYAMLEGDTVVWLTPHAAVARAGRKVVNYWGELEGSCRFCFSADEKCRVALARSPEHLLEICDVVLRLLAASVVHSVILHKYGSRDGALINAPTLAYLMEQCQSLKVLTLENVEALDEDQIRVLGAYSRPGLEIELIRCKLTSDGSSALAEVLGRDKGPTKLYFCEIDNSVLADGLRGISRLKSLTPRPSGNYDDGNRQVLAIAGALKENKGLVDLHLWYHFMMSDETWNAMCDSLKTHPTLQVLDLRSMVRVPMAPAVLTPQVQALVDMLKGNMSIHTIHVHDRYSEHKLFRGSVIPYLETNKLRPRVRAIQKTRSIMYRAKVLGRALVSARTDANSFWMLLLGNPEVAFPSTTAAAANLPTPAAAAATTSTAYIGAVVTASVMPALTTGTS
jgi:hypothetical protein